MDASGELFYNTDFMFSADSGAGIPKDPLFLFNQANNMLASQAVDKLQFWTILESLNFPMAKEIKSQVEQQMQQQQQMAQQQAMDQQAQAQQQQIQSQQQNEQQQMAEQEKQPHIFDQLLAKLPKHEQEQFKKASPEQQKAIMDQMMASLGGQNEQSS